MLRISFVGAGKVGTTLMMLLRDRPGFEIGDVLSSRPESARQAVAQIGAGRPVGGISEMGAADLWFLTVPDDRIEGIARDLAETRCEAAAIAVHCSGFLASEALGPLRASGWGVASCHPVLSFADPVRAARRFPGTLCAIEGTPEAAETVGTVVADLGGRSFAVDPAKKALYHAAAVFSNNFTVVLQAIALEAWREAGVAEEVASELCRSLVRGTSDNLQDLAPVSALTGPAARGDHAVMSRQQATVAGWNPDAAEVYDLMSRLALRLKRSGSTLPG